LNAINGVLPIYQYWKRSLKDQLHYLSSIKFSGNYPTTLPSLVLNKIESNKVEVENINFNLKQLLIDEKPKKEATKTTIAFILEGNCPNIPG
jgi:hypothetical protein